MKKELWFICIIVIWYFYDSSFQLYIPLSVCMLFNGSICTVLCCKKVVFQNACSHESRNTLSQLLESVRVCVLLKRMTQFFELFQFETLIIY